MFRLKTCLSLSNVTRLARRFSTSIRHCSEELNVHRDSADNNCTTPFEFTEANMIATPREERTPLLQVTYNLPGEIPYYRLAAIIQNYPEGAQRSAVSAAMDIVQRQIGWIPISAMHKVAELLQMPRMRVYEWATFYTMNKRHFRGKFHVKVCVTTPCMLRGSDIIQRAVEEATCCCVGSLSDDGMFGVDIVQCQGACANAPVVVVNDDYYEDLNVYDVHNIIQTLRCGGIPPFGPQNGRYSCEPSGGQTCLCEHPPLPGFGLQPALHGPC